MLFTRKSIVLHCESMVVHTEINGLSYEINGFSLGNQWFLHMENNGVS